jgi:RHS repeat-associated protein
MGRQLASYDKGSLSIDYTYNENGIRTSKTVNNVRTEYYLNGSQVIAEVTNGNRIDYRYDGNSQLIALRYNGNEYYYVTNIQGDIISLIDGSGTSVVQYSHDAWGNQTSCTGTLANTLGQANPYRYRGYRFDNESGLYYLQSRYYDAAVGRFVNADDYNLLQLVTADLVTMNIFSYCTNSPIIHYDPTGMVVTLVIAGIAISVAEAIAIALTLVFCVSYILNIGGFRTTVNNAVNWAINQIVTHPSSIQRIFSQIGTWASGIIASIVAIYVSAAAKKLPGIAGKYKPQDYACNKAAEEMKQTLRKLKLHGQIITLTFPNAYNGYVMSNRFSFAISRNYFHMGVAFNGIVYCPVYPEGIPVQKWINSFYAAAPPKLISYASF